MVLISGGSGSGKSEMAEKLIYTLAKGKGLIYMATMQPFDSETYERILRHQSMRKDKNFTTMEVYQDIRKVKTDSNSSILLECMSNLLANEMFCKSPQGNVYDKIIGGIETLKNSCKNLVVVSNEVFSDGCNYDTLTVEYVRTLGKVNQRLAKLSDCVIECTYGSLTVYKGDLSWFG